MKYKINYKILIPVILLSIISIITIYSSLTYTSPSLGNLALKQAIWYGVGWILVFILVKLGNDYLYRHTWVLYIVGNVLLLLLLFFGTPINNSRCWFTVPGIGSIQPSEFMKIFIMLVLANMIHNFRSDYKNPDCKDEFIFILKTLGVLLIPSILTFLQPDTGAVLIYFVIYFSMMFISGIRLRWFFISLLIISIIVGSILFIYFNYEDIFIKLFGTSFYYRLERIFNWQDGSGLQLENSLAAIGSAGLFGHGFNKTPIYFPESSTDFIFAVFASNFGLVGVIILLGIIIFFDVNVYLLKDKKIEDTNRFIIIGILGMLVFQQIQNIGMTLGIFPITGITLPFISYGGSSLLSYMLLIGILINISMRKNRTYKYK
jgi:rod shape determining protein RodA